MLILGLGLGLEAKFLGLGLDLPEDRQRIGLNDVVRQAVHGVLDNS